MVKQQHQYAGRRTKKFAAMSAIASVVLSLAGAFVATPALAADLPAGSTLPSGLTTLFQIDGDMAGPNDWDTVSAGTYGPYLTPNQGYRSTGILGVTGGSEYCVGGTNPGTDNTIFRPSTKIDTNPWPTTSGAPNKKSDICDAGAAFEIVDVNGQQHIIMYQYWTRSPDGTGDLTVYQELKGGAAGRDGDYLLEFNYNSSGGGGINIRSLRWNGSSWVAGAAVYDADYGTNGVDGNVGTFGESAVDLTASGLLPEDRCLSVESGWIISKTGEGNGNLEDYLAPTNSITFSTCTSFEVSKNVIGSVPEGTTFPYVIDQRDGKTVHETATATGTSSTGTNPTDQDTSLSTITSVIADGETHTWNNVVAQPDYRVTENVGALPAGVTLRDVTCTYTDLFQAGRPVVTTTIWENGDWTGNTVPLFGDPLTPTAECTMTNVVTSLTLDKVLVNDHNGPATLADFTLQAQSSTSPTPIISGPDPDPATGVGLTALVNPGTYNLSELVPAALQNLYTSSAWSCVVRAEDGSTTPKTVTNNQVTIAAQEAVECAITNDDKPATLTLVKQVTNTNGGTAVDTDFTLTATGPDSISGIEGAPSVTNAQVKAGTYEIGETAVAGYSQQGVACWTAADRATPLTVNGTSVDVANGSSAYCEVTNVDVAPKLTLEKIVTNTFNGPATVADWTLTATGPVTISGETGDAEITAADVSAGTYTLSEAGTYSSAYDMLAWSCTGGQLAGDQLTLVVGDNAVCRIENKDKPATLTLAKNVENTHGGTAVDTDFALTATGPDTISGVEGSATVTNAQVKAGTYTLSETPLAGYEQTGLACWTAADKVTPVTLTGDAITIANGGSAYCEITNADIAPKLTLVKNVVNDNGGAATTADFPLTATGPDTITGVTGDAAITAAEVVAGTYTLSEQELAGYEQLDWTCVGGGTLTGASLELGIGEEVTCTVTNDDIAPKLTLVKSVTNDDGGTAVATDWTLTAAGATPLPTITGKTGDAAVTAAAVSAGSYALSEDAGPAGYAAEGWTCVGGSLSGSTVTVGVGDDVTCTVTNNDIAPRLTLEKVVINDNGGTATATDWTLQAEGASETITGAHGSPAVTNADVTAGTFALSEFDGPAGYSQVGWVCNGQPSDGSVTVAIGTLTKCVVTNDDNAATLTLKKNLVNDHNGQTTLADWTLTATGPTAVTGAADSADVMAVAVDAGSYVLSEDGPAGYDRSVWTCTGGTQTGGSGVDIAAGDVVVCEVTNNDQPAKITLTKEVVNSHGGTAEDSDFTLTATSGATVLSGSEGDAAITGAEVSAGVWTIGEEDVAGYQRTALSCWSDEARENPLAVSGDAVTLGNGESAFCEITNEDIASTLTLIKQVENPFGGASVVSDWTLTATGPTTAAGVTGDPAVTVAEVSAGDYTLSESGPDGYTASDWSCVVNDGDPMMGSELAIELDQDVVCTIVNTAEAAHLTLTKVVVNDHGGTAVDTDFTLKATMGDTMLSGAEGDASITNAEVSAGSYVISEDPLDGYDMTNLACWSDAAHTDPVVVNGAAVDVGNGDDVFCEITNDDMASTLTLIKQVENVNGGTSVVGDWTLSADGPTPLEGATGDAAVTAAEVSAGAYTLSEAGPEGYAASDWTCVADETETIGSSVTIGLGQDVVCTIVNTDQPGHLTLTKNVINDDGGTAVDGDFTLTATMGDTVLSGVEGDAAITNAVVSAGTYTIGETAVDGYEQTDLACWADAERTTPIAVDGAAVVVANGQDVFCEITNDDVDTTVDLELTKDDGGITATVGMEFDYTITVTNVGSVPLDPESMVTVRDMLPVGMVFVSSDSDCVASGQEVLCTVDPAELAPGESVVIMLTVMFDESAEPGSYTNIASVSTTGDEGPTTPTCPEPAPANARAATSTADNNVDCEETPLVEGMVSLEKSVWEKNAAGAWGASDGVANFGDSILYRVDVTATGSGASTDVTVIDRIDDGLITVGTASCTVTCAATYDAATRTHKVVFASLEPGTTASVTILVTLPPVPEHKAGTTVGDAWTNIAVVHTSTQDPTPSNEVKIKASHTTPPLAVTGIDPIGTGVAWSAALLLILGLALMRRRSVVEIPQHS